MKKSDMQRILRRQGALLLAVLLTFQNGFAAWGSVPREEVQAVEPSSENTSFVSFPSRFEDELPEGYEEQYYIFSLESRCDLTASVTFEAHMARNFWTVPCPDWGFPRNGTVSGL